MVEKINLDPLIEKHKNQLDSILLPQEKMVTNYERRCLGALALEYSKGLSLLEFGTWRGLTTLYLAQVCPHQTIFTVNIDTLDTNQINKHQPNELLSHNEIGEECKHLPNVKIIYKDSGKLLDELENVKLGLTFVDGGHDWTHVFIDWLTSMKYTQKDGIIAFHNYNPNHIAKQESVDDFVEGGICLLVQRTQDLKWKHIEKTCIVYFQL